MSKNRISKDKDYKAAMAILRMKYSSLPIICKNRTIRRLNKA